MPKGSPGTAPLTYDPDFSPDGREIIYTSYKRGNPDLFRKELFSSAEAVISARRGINITGAYSPDGKKIALAMSKDGSSNIYLIDTAGKLLARLTYGGSINVSPSLVSRLCSNRFCLRPGGETADLYNECRWRQYPQAHLQRFL
jgi:TolB protein